MLLLLASPLLFAQVSSPEITITHRSGLVCIASNHGSSLTVTLPSAVAPKALPAVPEVEVV